MNLYGRLKWSYTAGNIQPVINLMLYEKMVVKSSSPSNSHKRSCNEHLGWFFSRGDEVFIIKKDVWKQNVEPPHPDGEVWLLDKTSAATD